ncbi:hypothetical protein [Streptomyces sp. NPDC001415]
MNDSQDRRQDRRQAVDEPREQRVADTFVLLADTLTDDFDLVEFFQTLCERCIELLPVTAAGLLLVRPTDNRLQPCA